MRTWTRYGVTCHRFQKAWKSSDTPERARGMAASVLRKEQGAEDERANQCEEQDDAEKPLHVTAHVALPFMGAAGTYLTTACLRSGHRLRS